MSDERGSAAGPGAAGAGGVVAGAAGEAALGAPVGAAPPDEKELSGARGAGGAARWVGRRLIAHPLGKLVAVVVGALIGIAVQAGVESTGVLGPGIDQLIDRQEENFAALEAKLEELRSVEDAAAARSLASEIGALVSDQRSASERMADEIRGLRAENEDLKGASLERTGTAAGAGVWLKPGESITVAGRPGNVFTLMSFTYRGRTDDMYVNASGRPGRMVIGGHQEFPADGGVWRVIYKQSQARADGRVGFDVVFVPEGG